MPSNTMRKFSPCTVTKAEVLEIFEGFYSYTAIANSPHGLQKSQDNDRQSYWKKYKL